MLIKRLSCYLTLHRSGSSGANGYGWKRGRRDNRHMPCSTLDRQIVLQKLETEPPPASGIVFMSGDSASVPSPTRVFRPMLRILAPRSPAHFARKSWGSDVRRTRPSPHRWESSSSSRVSSILTEPSTRLQRGHVESCVPLSLCLRMKLRGSGAATEGPLL